MPSSNVLKTESACPVCGTVHIRSQLCRIEEFDIFQCEICNADFVFPVPSDADLKSYYDRAAWFEGGEAGGYANYDQQTAWSVQALAPVLQAFKSRPDLSVLDVGCGYGSHLELAASMGWKCFGVEISDHARQIAMQRLAGKAYITESVGDLIPHAFDLILLLDVIEHLPSPYALFYSLFSIGAITPNTQIVISTPNAGSLDARRSPAQWVYRHPPSHLVFYTAQTLQFLLGKLHFTQVDVTGIHPFEGQESAQPNWQGHAGLLATAKGSDFTEFMRERYVPGTWSKVAEYEHFPRYALAKRAVAGKAVLDFGCGTGYGSALLSEGAIAVTGLDIDSEAISWANATHVKPNLRFLRSEDLGAVLPPASFDMVTCFEMIEHVDYKTQQAVIASIGRLLRDDGVLLISTPNPEVTKLYGENPFHLREMNLQEFNELLGAHFPHVRMLEQRVRNSIAFDEIGATPAGTYSAGNSDLTGVEALAFIAVCSKKPLPAMDPFIFFDEAADPILDFLEITNKRNAANAARYGLEEKLAATELELQSTIAHATRLQSELQVHQEMVKDKDAGLAKQAHEIHTLNESVGRLDAACYGLEEKVAATGLKLQAIDAHATRLQSELQIYQEMVKDKDAGLAQQAHEIHALNEEVIRRDAALRTQEETIQRLQAIAVNLQQTLLSQQDIIQNLEAKVQGQQGIIQNLEAVIAVKSQAISELSGELQAIRQSLWYRLGAAIKFRPLSARSIAYVLYLMTQLVLPISARPKLLAFVASIRGLRSAKTDTTSLAEPSVLSNAYEVKQPHKLSQVRPRILHVIANFNVGGSSRLVVDLMEHLGHHYEQSVLTSFIPNPPAYTNLQIVEFRHPADAQPFVNLFQEIQPQLIHIHYWGDVDEPWYAKAFQAAEQLKIDVIQNVNTPVLPYFSPSVRRYVYVSSYVQQVFGLADPSHITIYPGSDFSQFNFQKRATKGANRVGMVYRLERDKLNEDAILPFIYAVKQRPSLRVLIVGGGGLLEPFRQAVQDAGILENFEFTGYVAYADLPALYRQMSLFVAPVWKESFGQVSAFAMNMKIPVCGYDVGAIGEIVDNPALLAPAADAHALADVIVRLMDSPKERETVGNALQKRAQERFSVEAMIKAYRETYHQVTSVSVK